LATSSIAILWDMDGTIIDTKACHFVSWEETLKHHGYHLDRDIYDANFGRNTRTMLPLMLGFDPEPAFAASLLKEKEDLFLEAAPRMARLFDGVENWLAYASENQIPQAVASSGSIKNIKNMMGYFELTHYFDALVAGSDLPAKPEPDVFLKAARALNTPPEACIVIEDSLAGVRAAKNAGMTCIALASSHSREALKQADVVLDHFNAPPQSILSRIRDC
jgi:beta-phosphoglucomutase